MKVVLFCGGKGLRIAGSPWEVPKPMMLVGPRPVLWHQMRYFAHYGHTDFTLCVGHQADVIRDYVTGSGTAVLDMIEEVTLQGGLPLAVEQPSWRFTFSEAGLEANIGQRLRAARPLVENEDLFLANYGDVLTDAPLDQLIERFRASGKVAAFLAVRPSYSFHTVDADEDGTVRAVRRIANQDLWMNGGYFMLRPEIFDYLHEGDELVEETFQRLIEARKLMMIRYKGFWEPMDTLKERQHLDDLYRAGSPPWAVWQSDREARLAVR